MFKSTNTLFVHNAGALGDFCASLPVMKYGIDQYFKDGNYVILCQKVFHPLLSSFVPKDKLADIADKDYKLPFSAAAIVFNEIVDMGGGKVGSRIHPLRMALWDYASIKLFNRVFDTKNLSYPQLDLRGTKSLLKVTDGSKYGCIIANHSAPNRKIAAEDINKIADYMLSKDITPVFIGKTTVDFQTYNVVYKLQEQIDFSKGINLMDKTSIIECAKVMESAEFVIGIDCGLMHLAGMTKCPIIGGYTIVSPELRMPIYNGVIGGNTTSVIPSGCRFCSNAAQIEGHDFNNCLYKTDACTKELTADKFIEAIDKVLNK